MFGGESQQGTTPRDTVILCIGVVKHLVSARVVISKITEFELDRVVRQGV